MKHDDEAHKYYYPVEGRTDGAIGDAIAFIAIILVPAQSWCTGLSTGT